MFALFLTAFLACSSETKETTTTENKTNTTETTKPTNKTTGPMTTTSNTSGTSDTTTTTTTGQTVDSQTTEVKEYVEKSVNTSETEQMFLLAFLFACTEDHFRIDSGILTIEACISIAPEGDCIRKKDKAIRSRSETK